MTEEQMFLAALDIAEPAARDARLDTACEGNAELHRHVEEPLNTHFKLANFWTRHSASRRILEGWLVN